MTISEVYDIMCYNLIYNLYTNMSKKVKKFGNLLNSKSSPYSIAYFRKHAIEQDRYGLYRLYIIDDKYAVGKVLNGKIVDYTILDYKDDYRELYSNSKASEEVRRQARYHGACILEGYGLGYDI